MNDLLAQGLECLDLELKNKNLEIEIVICGAYAIHLLGYPRSEYTLDVDTITQLHTPEVQDLIAEIGSKLGLGSQWLNDQASTVDLPDGILTRITPIRRWESIKAFLVSREDLIKMKASAFSIRRNHTNKDWEDLVLLSPTMKEIEAAIDFIKLHNSPPKNAPQQIQQDFMETINDLKNLAK